LSFFSSGAIFLQLEGRKAHSRTTYPHPHSLISFQNCFASYAGWDQIWWWSLTPQEEFWFWVSGRNVLSSIAANSLLTFFSFLWLAWLLLFG
jgi:hypothetical protein